MNLQLKITPVFGRNKSALDNPNVRYVVNQGGSRSSKTFSILQLLIYTALTKSVKISIVRKTLKSMKDSVISDFIQILRDLNIYDEECYNKTEQIYRFTKFNSEIIFFGADDDKKVRGTKRDIIYINEANEITNDVFIQLDIRTEGDTPKIFMDFNPSDTEHFIYDLLKRDNSILIKSTYLDNPFLLPQQVKALEDLILTDENYYRIYVLGEKPVSNSRIYTHFKEIDNEPIDVQYWTYGLDFGFNHATALIKIGHLYDGYYVKEEIYKSGLTIPDLIFEMDRLGISKTSKIWADSARPDAIEEIRRAGFYIQSANKDVIGGINKIKSSKIFVQSNSHNLLKEWRKYSWKTDKKTAAILNEPVKIEDDAMDAMRYGIWNERKGGGVDFYFSI